MIVSKPLCSHEDNMILSSHPALRFFLFTLVSTYKLARSHFSLSTSVNRISIFKILLKIDLTTERPISSTPVYP